METTLTLDSTVCDDPALLEKALKELERATQMVQEHNDPQYVKKQIQSRLDKLDYYNLSSIFGYLVLVLTYLQGSRFNFEDKNVVIDQFISSKDEIALHTKNTFIENILNDIEQEAKLYKQRQIAEMKATLDNAMLHQDVVLPVAEALLEQAEVYRNIYSTLPASEQEMLEKLIAKADRYYYVPSGILVKEKPDPNSKYLKVVIINESSRSKQIPKEKFPPEIIAQIQKDDLIRCRINLGAKGKNKWMIKNARLAERI